MAKSNAADATLIANGANFGSGPGRVSFLGKSDGAKARVEVFADGNLDIRFHDPPGVTIGSLEGTGLVFPGQNNLTVGSNNLDTTFSGQINGGSLTKVGTGTLTLARANNYGGGTTINRGKLLINSFFGTGTGPVRVNGGRLGGTGTIAGVVTVGNGTGRGAFLSPGKRQNPGTLTIQSSLAFNSDATYKVHLNTTRGKADKVRANGVTINSGAQFSFTGFGSGTLAVGTVFRVIDNTSASPITGTFINLADGSTFSNDGNSYQVDYQGGDGNDLTLKVVP